MAGAFHETSSDFSAWLMADFPVVVARVKLVGLGCINSESGAFVTSCIAPMRLKEPISGLGDDCLVGNSRHTELAGRYWREDYSLGQRVAEFEKVIDHRGWPQWEVFAPLAQLGLARAYATQGDRDESRKAYQEFFTTWKDADPDVPILRQAKAEYKKLGGR